MLEELYSLRVRVILRQIQIIFCSFFDLHNPPSDVKNHYQIQNWEWLLN